MLGFRKPRVPLTTMQRVDIELLLRRSIETVGRDLVCNVDVPTDIGELNLDQSSPEALLSSADIEVRHRMRMDSVNLDLKIVDGRELGYPSTYKAGAAEGCSTIISVADDTAEDPLRTVAELAYQYSYHYWRSRPDHRPLDIDPRTTNLLPVCFGFGVLASGACLYDQQWSQAGWSGWSISRSGYYNAVELGFALALFARARGESKPPWSRSLRLDSRVTFDQTWRYFSSHQARRGQLLFDAARIPSSAQDMNELAGWLGGDDLPFALAAGFALSKFDELSPRAIDAAMKATDSGDLDLVPVAVRLLAGARNDSPELIDRVCRLVLSSSPQTSLAAIQCANALGVNLKPFAKTISKLLDAMSEDAFDLLTVIGQQGHRFSNLDSKICRLARPAIKHSDDELVDAFLLCLTKIVDDPQASIRRHLKGVEYQEVAMKKIESLTQDVS